MALSDACFDALLGIEEYQETMGYEELADRCRNVKLELAILGRLADGSMLPEDEESVRQEALVHPDCRPADLLGLAFGHPMLT